MQIKSPEDMNLDSIQAAYNLWIENWLVKSITKYECSE